MSYSRCLALGYNFRVCSGRDRRGSCRQCGVNGHLAKNCVTGSAVAGAFQRVLEMESVAISAPTGVAVIDAVVWEVVWSLQWLESYNLTLNTVG